MYKLHSLHYIGMIVLLFTAWHFYWFGMSDDSYGSLLLALMFASAIHVYYLARNGELAYEHISHD